MKNVLHPLLQLVVVVMTVPMTDAQGTSDNSDGTKAVVLRSQHLQNSNRDHRNLSTATYYDASPYCPCINPWTNYTAEGSSNSSEVPPTCDADQFLTSQLADATNLDSGYVYACLPVGFGAEDCRPWDMYQGWVSEGCEDGSKSEYFGTFPSF